MNRNKSAYDAEREADADTQECAVCSIAGSKRSMDRHHPRGRHGDNLLSYVYVHRLCHKLIHDNPKWAEGKGLLVRNR